MQCSRCKTKAKSAFYPTSWKRGWSCLCKKCKRAWRHKHYSDPENLANKRAYTRKYQKEHNRVLWRCHLRHKFGIDDALYDKILKAQGDVCAICREKCKTGQRLGVDHNHKTGGIRGLLCSTCNRGIGYLQESPDILLAAVEYLKRLPWKKPKLKPQSQWGRQKPVKKT